MNESQPTQDAQTFFRSQLSKIEGWNFRVSPNDSRNFLLDLINEIRDVYDHNGLAWVPISEGLLSQEIKKQLEYPYGDLSVLLGRGSESTHVKEDRGKTTLIVQGEGPRFVDHWCLYFVFENDHIRLHQESVVGRNSINVIRFENRYKNDEKVLLKIVGELTKASLTQASKSISEKTHK